MLFEWGNSFCGSVFFDPIRTWFHGVLMLLVPLVNAWILRATARGEFRRPRLMAGLGGFGARVTQEGAVDDWHLHDGDEVRVPYVALASDADLTGRLQGLQWMKERAAPRRVVHAVQRTNFRLLETGAEVRVEVEMSMDPFADAPFKAPPIIPRQFIYDGPFFVFLWRERAEWPYFGCWVGDGEALQAFE